MTKDVIKENIIAESILLFTKYGLRSVTMDDIAKHMGMSKKTIYLHFKDKEEIIIRSTTIVFEQEKRMMNEIEAEAGNAVEQLYNLTFHLRERIKNTSTTSLFDMKKYYPSAWTKYKNFKHDIVYNSVINNLKRGIEEGLFRVDINPEILALLRIQEIELSFDKDFFQHDKLSLVEIHEQLFEHFTYGILSEQGIKLFENYKQKNNINEVN